MWTVLCFVVVVCPVWGFDTVLGGDQIYQGTEDVHLTGVDGVGYVTVSSLVWGSLGWDVDLAAGDAAVNVTGVVVPYPSESSDGPHDWGLLEDRVLQAAMETCTSEPAGSTVLGAGTWGVHWSGVDVSTGTDGNVTSVTVDVTCVGTTVRRSSDPVDDGRPGGGWRSRVGPGVKSAQWRQFDGGPTTDVVRGGSLSLCWSPWPYGSQCSPMFHASGVADSWISTGPRSPVQPSVSTRCAVFGGRLDRCACSFTNESQARRFRSCEPCHDEGAHTGVLSINPTYPYLSRGYGDDTWSSLQCFDAQSAYTDWCEALFSTPVPRFDWDWAGEPAPDPDRTGRWPPVRCDCYDPNRGPGCRGCAHGWYTDTSDPNVAGDTMHHLWRCQSCKTAVEADTNVTACAWNPPMEGAYRPDELASDEPVDYFRRGVPGVEYPVPDCKAGPDGDYVTGRLQCVCRPGHVGAACDTCDADNDWRLLNGTCHHCPPDTCGDRQVRLCGETPDGPVNECVCQDGFGGFPYCDTCPRGGSVCGPGGVCSGDFGLGDVQCTCDAGWAHTGPSVSPSVLDTRPCSSCHPTEGLAVVDAPVHSTNACVSVYQLCNGTTGVDLAATRAEGACKCEPGYVSSADNSITTEGTPILASVTSPSFPGCRPVSDVCGGGALEVESTAANACVCGPGSVEMENVCVGVWKFCGYGAVDGSMPGACVCNESRWLPATSTASGKCTSCQEGRSGPFCLLCSDACEGNRLCVADALPDGTPHVCECLMGWREPACEDCDDGWTLVDAFREPGDTMCVKCPDGGCGHGECRDIPMAFRMFRPDLWGKGMCVCDPGWWNDVASDMTSPCNTCKDGFPETGCVGCGAECVAPRATCVVNGSEPTCVCAGNWEGPPLCRGCVSGTVLLGGQCVPCERDCGAHGSCSVSPITASEVCTCDTGWTGDDCDACVPRVFGGPNCTACPEPCEGHSFCDGQTCTCPPGWFGDTCQFCDPRGGLDGGCSDCPCWKASTDPARTCEALPIVDAPGYAMTCSCGPGFTHADRGDGTSPCRPCDPSLESQSLCLACPLCDPVSETCEEVQGPSDGDGLVAACVCRDGWSKWQGFADAEYACYPASVIQSVQDRRRDKALLAAKNRTAAMTLSLLMRSTKWSWDNYDAMDPDDQIKFIVSTVVGCLSILLLASCWGAFLVSRHVTHSLNMEPPVHVSE